MKNLIILSLLATAALSSCIATHNGVVSSSSVGKPVKYVDIAYGVAQTNTFLGLGGTSVDALTYEAKRNLIKSRPLNPGEQYVNFTTDFKRTYILFYFQTKVTLTAEVISLQKDKTGKMYSDTYLKKLEGKKPDIELFEVGDTVMNKKEEVGVIISFKNDRKARILYISGRDKLKSKTVFLDEIFVRNKEYNGYRVGDKYIYKNWNTSSEKPLRESGTIIALGLKKLLISRDKDQTLVEQKYRDYREKKPTE